MYKVISNSQTILLEEDCLYGFILIKLELLNWIRDEFFYSPIKSKKRIFFGHTPTQFLNKDKSNDIWVSKYGDKIGIDGGCVFGGQLNGVKINRDGEIKAIIKVPRKK